MTPKNQRSLIRFAGFAGGALVGLALFRPWQEDADLHGAAAVVLVLVSGLFGVAFAEFARRFVPGQRQLDADEADALSDAELRRLLRVRRYVRLAALATGFVLPLVVFYEAGTESGPAFVIAVCLYYAFVVWVFAEIALSLHPRQRILRAALRRRRAASP